MYYFKLKESFNDYFSYIKTLSYSLKNYLDMLLIFDKERIKKIKKITIGNKKDYNKNKQFKIYDVF